MGVTTVVHLAIVLDTTQMEDVIQSAEINLLSMSLNNVTMAIWLMVMGAMTTVR